MLPHVFAHDGILYEVSFGRIAGQWLAAVGQLSEGSKRLLPALAEADCEQFSEAAIRAGYAGVAEWLVRTGRWEKHLVRSGRCDTLAPAPSEGHRGRPISMRISGASRHRRPRPSWDVRRAACSPLSFYKNAPFGGSKRGEALKSSWLLSRASLPLSMSSADHIALKVPVTDPLSSTAF